MSVACTTEQAVRERGVNRGTVFAKSTIHQVGQTGQLVVLSEHTHYNYDSQMTNSAGTSSDSAAISSISS